MTRAAIIRGDQMEQHDVQPAPWVEEGPAGVSALMRALLSAGTVQRWELLNGALELTRREAAAQALEAAAADLLAGDVPHVATVPAWLEQRAELHRDGEL